MKHDSLNPLMVRLILTTGILLLFTWGASAAEMKGTKNPALKRGVVAAGICISEPERGHGSERWFQPIGEVYYDEVNKEGCQRSFG